jgi:hypothetical protein
MRGCTWFCVGLIAAILLGSSAVFAQDGPEPPNPFEDDSSPEVVDTAPAMPDAMPPTALVGEACCSLIDHIPVPYPHPGAEHWAGYCEHCDCMVPCCCGPAAWAAIDVLWLERDEGDRYPLALDDNGFYALRSDDFNFGEEPGVRVIYGREIGCRPLQFTYFGTHQWSDSVAVFGDDDLDVPFAPLANGAFEDADEVFAKYQSKLHNLQLDTVLQEHCWWSVVGGLRYLYIDEDFRLVPDDPHNPVLADDGLLRVDADNHLLGLHAGVLAEQSCGNFCFNLAARIGGLLNFTESDLLLYDSDGVNTFRLIANREETELAFLSEIVFSASYHLHAGISLRGGYQMTLLNGVTLANEQVGSLNNGGSRINSDGSILYNGGFLGLEWFR